MPDIAPPDVLDALSNLPEGYCQGEFAGQRWGVNVERSTDGRRVKLFGEALGGNDHVSFNLYHVGGAARLKPCEMPAANVLVFLRGFTPDSG